LSKEKRMTAEELREGLKGVSMALTTPYKENEEVDLQALGNNVRFYLEIAKKHNKKLGFMVGGTVGEFYNLNDEEGRAIISTVVKAVGGKAVVLAATGRPSTKATVELSRWAVQEGADGVVVVLPYYVTPNEDGIYDHFKRITESVDSGVVLYDNTDATKIHLNPGLITKMAEDFPNFVGIKENSTDALYWYSLKHLQGRLTIYPGKGEVPYASFVNMGAAGFTTTIGNFAPEIAFEVFDAGDKKDYEKMYEALAKLAPYRKFLTKIGSKRTSTSALGKRFTTNFTYYAAIRAAAEIRGLKEGNLRSPLSRLTEEEKQELEGVLRSMGVV
jgi:4-hydroxy-tetrahydrodipicolinate synthase